MNTSAGYQCVGVWMCVSVFVWVVPLCLRDVEIYVALCVSVKSIILAGFEPVLQYHLAFDKLIILLKC